jgi:Na+/proline symporter
MDSLNEDPAETPEERAKGRKVVAIALASVVLFAVAVTFFAVGIIQTIAGSVDAGKVVVDGIPELLIASLLSIAALGGTEWAKRTRRDMVA